MFGFKPLREVQDEIPTVGQVWISSTGKRYRVEKVDGDRFYVTRIPSDGYKIHPWEDGLWHLWKLDSFRALTKEVDRKPD